MSFKRYQAMPTTKGVTVDLVPAIAASTSLVIGRVRITPSLATGSSEAPGPVNVFLYLIPSGQTEGPEYAILWNQALAIGNPFEETQIVMEAGDTLAVGFDDALSHSDMRVTFTAFGEEVSEA